MNKKQCTFYLEDNEQLHPKTYLPDIRSLEDITFYHNPSPARHNFHANFARRASSFTFLCCLNIKSCANFGWQIDLMQ